MSLWLPSVSINFTLGDTNTPAASTWLHNFVGLSRQHSATISTTLLSSYAQTVNAPIYGGSATNGSKQFVLCGNVTPGAAYDFAVVGMDFQGNMTAVAPLAQNYTVGKVNEGYPLGPIIGKGHLIGDTTGDISTAISSGTEFIHGIMSSGVQDVISSGGGVNVNPTGGVTGHLPQVNHDPQIVTSAVTGTSRNLVPDSDFQFSGNNAAAAAEFWFAGGSVSSGFTPNYNTNGMSIYWTGTGVAIGYNDRRSKTIPVQPGQPYTLSGYINAGGVTSGSPGWAVYDPTVSTSYGVATQTAGATGRVSATFTVPSGVTSVVVICDTSNCTIPNGYSLFFASPQLEFGSTMTSYKPNLQDWAGTWDYTVHAPALTNTLDVNGNLKGSTAFQTYTPSLPPFTTNMNMWLYSPTGATYIWVYITSGATQTTNAGTIWLSNNTSISVPAFSHQYTGLTVGNTYYSGATYDPVSQVWTVIAPQTTPLSYAQLQSLFVDGYLLFQSSATIAAGNGTSTGGGGCPAVGQIIETKEAGFVPAECVRTGYHLRHPDGGWREVLHAGAPTPAIIYAVTFNTETIYVDASHLFEKKLGSERWANVQELRCGDRFDGVRGLDDLVVQHISNPMSGSFVPLHVDGYRYTLGETISHNIKTN